MATLWQDIRYSLRMLGKTPGFTAVAVLTLAIGIGASTAIFSGVNALWFNPVPSAEPDRIVQIRAFNREKNTYSGPSVYGVGAVIVQELLAHPECFDDLSVITPWSGNWENAGWIETISGARVSPNFFSYWDSRPWLGRTFIAEDGRPGAPPVIVLSHRFWKNRLGSDPNWIGRSLRMQGQFYTVIGVMRPHFRFPSYADDFWIPVGYPQVEPAEKDPRGSRFWPNWGVIAGLAPGVSLGQAQALLDVLARQHEEENRKQGWGYTILHARPVREVFADSDLQRTIPGFLGAMVLVFLIACANVANLNLARTEARQHELAVRSALGAGRLRLLRQALMEGLLVAMAGALAGMVLTHWSLGLMERLVPLSIARMRPIELDWHVLAYTLSAAVAAGLISATVPAWWGATRPVTDALRQAGVQTTPGVFRNLYRRGLVVFEVSMAMLLLVCAGLMIHSVVNMLRADLGFDQTNLVHVRIYPWGPPGMTKYRTLEAKNLLMEEIHRRFCAVPGVDAVGMLVRFYGRGQFTINGRSEAVELDYGASGVGAADAFRIMRVPLLRGRCLDERDLGASATAVVVNETLARHCWPGGDAVGMTIRGATEEDDRERVFEVVGVVADIHDRDLTGGIRPTFYQPHQQGFITQYDLFVRTRVEPAGLIKPLLEEAKAVAPGLEKPEYDVVRDALYDSTRPQRTYMCFLGMFGAMGLLLASVGVYAILAHSVALREREMGIRMALGAEGPDMLRMVLRQGMTLVAIGIALGVGAACVLTRLLRNALRCQPHGSAHAGSGSPAAESDRPCGVFPSGPPGGKDRSDGSDTI